MSELLTVSNVFRLAEEMHQEGVGRDVGLVPLFCLTCWLNARMGCSCELRRREIYFLITQHAGRVNLDFELTGDAVTFLMLMEKDEADFDELLATIEKRILARRARPKTEQLKV